MLLYEEMYDSNDTKDMRQELALHSHYTCFILPISSRVLFESVLILVVNIQCKL